MRREGTIIKATWEGHVRPYIRLEIKPSKKTIFGKQLLQTVFCFYPMVLPILPHTLEPLEALEKELGVKIVSGINNNSIEVGTKVPELENKVVNFTLTKKVFRGVILPHIALIRKVTP